MIQTVQQEIKFYRNSDFSALAIFFNSAPEFKKKDFILCLINTKQHSSSKG